MGSRSWAAGAACAPDGTPAYGPAGVPRGGGPPDSGPAGSGPAGSGPPGSGPPGSGPPDRHAGWRQHQHDHPGGLAIVIALGQVVGAMLTSRNQPGTLDLFGIALLAVGALALGARRRHPVATLVVATAATVTYHALDYPSGPTVIALVVAAIAAAKAGRRYHVLVIITAAYAAWVLLTGPTLHRAAVLLAWTVGLLLAAEWARVAGEYRARADQVRRERARASEEQQRRQASDERLRIARELHDVLGHHLSLINVQAGVGLHLMDNRPEQARAALGTIRQASAEALREVRSVLDALNPGGEAAPRAPAPGLAGLVALTTDAGLRVDTEVRGESRSLPPEVDRSAYRIVQEALTNVRRHAGAGAAASVVISYREGELVVQVDDDGGGEPAAGTDRPASPMVEGNGIGGMRERATALGGSLSARPRPDGGFRVQARLPLPPPAAAPEPEGVA